MKFNPRGEVAPALYLSALKLLLHFLTNGHYGVLPNVRSKKSGRASSAIAVDAQ